MCKFYYCYGRCLMTLNNDKIFYNDQTQGTLGRAAARWAEGEKLFNSPLSVQPQKHFLNFIKIKLCSLHSRCMFHCSLKVSSLLLNVKLRQQECFNIESSCHVS